MTSDREHEQVSRWSQKFNQAVPPDRRRAIIKYGGVLVAAHFVWGFAVLRYVGQSDPLYLPLMAPAGLVANFFLPFYLVIIALHLTVDTEPEATVDV